MSKKLICLVGTRPNFIKIAPIYRLLQETEQVLPLLVHTGQHYDKDMSQRFFEELEIPTPEFNLGVGSGSRVYQLAEVMRKLTPVIEAERPDMLLVVGDVNSTLAGALTAVKIGVPVAHVEAGLRSFDRSMPEEINRLLTDALAELLFVTEPSGRANLLEEGIDEEKIFLVGNVMIDTLVANLEKIRAARVLERLGLEPGKYATLTLHRPSNVDVEHNFRSILRALEAIQKDLPVVFPVHPRTARSIEKLGLGGCLERMPALRLTSPLGYPDFLKLVSESKLVLTDSGGLQEETTFLGIPCLTLRENTERPITTEIGTNVVVGTATGKILAAYAEVAANRFKKGKVPAYWDGQAAERTIAIVLRKI